MRVNRRAIVFSIALAVSPLAMASTASQIPFVHSSVSGPDFNSGQYGRITTTSYDRFGTKTVKTDVIDLDTYAASGGRKLILGANAIHGQSTADDISTCADPGLDGTCMDPGSGNGNTGVAGIGGSYGNGGNINPNGSGPGAGPPGIPDEPVLPASQWRTGTVTITQYYDQGKMQQQTTYNRNVYPDPNGDGSGSDGPWGPPVVVDSPTKGH